jgi:tetratricopeptide (TPR) repeat protein
MADKKAKRERGRLLTDAGWNKLDTALQAWEVLPGNKRSFEKIALETQLDPGTIAKIMKRREGADLTKIEQVFRAFKLSVEVEDHAVLQEAAQTADPDFVGREGAIADLQALVDRHTKVIVIQARGGVGKTTLARKYLQQKFGTFLEFPIAKETKDIASVESLIEEKLRQLGEEPGREFLVSIDRLKRKLQSERIGILIDNLEPALDSAGKLIEAHRRYVELLRVLADPTVRSLTLITTRERLREPSITVQHYLLRSLDVAAWESYFQARNIGTEGEALVALHNAYGGNAKAMDILSGAIAEDFAGDMAAYWRVNQDDLLIERDLEDLVTTQFERIRELDGDAYNLLCRMGCYRYQDVPRVPIEGLLCLLWDVAEGQRRRVVKALQDRSLVDCVEGEYWLHPVIRGEAIGRLRECEDWKEANNRAAEFWSVKVESINEITDLLEAFEAYYHHLAIGDYEQAGEVLFRSRKSFIVAPADKILLGSSFHRLGLSRQLILAINQIIDNTSSMHRSSLHNFLGIAHRSMGEIRLAIENHEQSVELADRHINESEFNSTADITNVKSLKIRFILNIGICSIDLWELEAANSVFLKANSLFSELDSSEIDDSQSIQETVDVFLIFLESHLNPGSEVIGRLDQSYSDLKKSSLLGSSYRLLHLGISYRNLKENDKAMLAFQEAISRADILNYTEIKARALSYIGEIYALFRNFDKALDCHTEALGILEILGARFELAKAYYYAGLTYRVMHQLDKGDALFQQSIRLFTEMEAPKQVERVRRSMHNHDVL